MVAVRFVTESKSMLADQDAVGHAREQSAMEFGALQEYQRNRNNLFINREYLSMKNILSNRCCCWLSQRLRCGGSNNGVTEFPLSNGD